MRSDKSLICRPRRRFRSVASHNPALRIIDIMRRTALCGVRTGRLKERTKTGLDAAREEGRIPLIHRFPGRASFAAERNPISTTSNIPFAMMKSLVS